MPVPSSFNDISTTASANSPGGSETVGTNANDYFQVAFAFIKQIYTGSIKPAFNVDFNGKRITNLATGSVNSGSTDAVTGAQLQSVYKPGEVKMYHGAPSNIAAVWGAGWQLADGTNGTADLRDRFVVGAGLNYGTNATGGANFVTLTVAQMPSHAHVLNDPGHNHVLNQTPHGHAISDPGHTHGLNSGRPVGSSGGTGTLAGGGSAGITDITASGTGIGIQPQLANVSMNSALSGLSMVSAGNDNSHENRPPYYALCFIEYTGIGA